MTSLTIETEIQLRIFLWLNHGHTGQYGDDGEMQCSMCARFGTYDYKRSTFEEILETINNIRIQQLIEYNKNKES